MKKNQFAKILAITMALIVLTISFLSTFQTQAQTKDFASFSRNNVRGGSGMGCYTSDILDCGMQLGQQRVCNFTGSYGAPYHCDNYSCYGSTSARECVQGH